MRKTIITVIPNLGTGGAQRVFSNLNMLLEEKFEVICCAFSDSTGVNQFDNLPTHYLNVGAGRNFIEKFWNFYLRIIRLRKLKKKYRAAFCISHMEGANFINVLSGVSNNILVLHGSKVFDQEISDNFPVINKWMIKLLYNRPFKIVTVSKAIKSELIDYFGVKSSKIEAIPNFFDFDKINLKANEPTKSEVFEKKLINNKVVIHCGRFHPSKNHIALIRIFNELRELDNKVTLVLLGEGNLRQDIIDECLKLGLKVYDVHGDTSDESADVLLLGNVTNPYSFLSRSQLFLFPSKWEGFPLALCEALICGLQVISSDFPPGPNEIIEKGDSLFGNVLPIPGANDTIDLWAATAFRMLNKTDNLDKKAWEVKLRLRISKEVVMKSWLKLIER